MKKRLLLAIGIALVLVVIGVVNCTDFYSSGPDAQENGTIWSQQNRGIWVTGEGKVAVIPDLAILSLGIESQAAIVAQAQQQAAAAMAAVMSALDEHGVASKDITTQYFSIQPVRKYEDGKEILLGYRVTNIVTVKIRNVEDTGSIIDAVAAAGGDYTRINSISFTVADPEDYNEEARKKAMADAKAKAKQLADLSGVKLGKPTYINEYGGYISPVVFRDFGLTEGAATTPISPGEMELQVTVQVVYSIS